MVAGVFLSNRSLALFLTNLIYKQSMKPPEMKLQPICKHLVSKWIT